MENKIKELEEKLLRKKQECEKWKSYYKLYRIETDIVKKVQGVINSNQKYGIEFTEDGIICKDERLSYLEVHEQVKLIIDEQAKELDQLKIENKKLKQTLDEIKEMCSEMDCESLMQNSWCGNTDFKMGCCEKFFKKQILQKISEVENEN